MMMYHKYDQIATHVRSLTNRFKYGSTVARMELVAYMRETADKLEREERIEKELANQFKLNIDGSGNV